MLREEKLDMDEIMILRIKIGLFGNLKTVINTEQQRKKT
jgi:hypothetical protein